jgi:hypothetical protein
MSDDLLNMRRRVSGALYQDRFSASEAEHLLTGSDPDADLSGTNAIARVKSIGDAIVDMASTEKYAVDALLYALVRCKTAPGHHRRA